MQGARGEGDIDVESATAASEALQTWVCEIRVGVEMEMDEEHSEERWMVDDVTGGILGGKEVSAARGEEVGFMERRRIWSVRPVRECWDETGKAPVSVRWVDTRKGSGEVRCRLVATDCKGGEKGRDDR